MSLLDDRDEAAVALPDETGEGDIMARLLDGQLRKELGLSSQELRAGLSVARNHMLRGAPLEALRIYAALVLCDPTNVDFQVGLANCAGHIGEHYLAIQAASAVIALAPSDPRGYLLSGRSCMLSGAFDEAREDLEEARDLARASGKEDLIREVSQLIERLSVATDAEG